MNGIETRTATRRASFGRADSARSAATRQGFAPAQTQAPLIDIRQMAARSFAVMGRNTVPFLALIAAAAAPERILYHTMNLHSATTFVILELVTAVSCGPLYVAVLSGALADLGGETVSFGNCLRAALRASLAATLLGLGSALAVWFLLIVPGIGRPAAGPLPRPPLSLDPPACGTRSRVARRSPRLAVFKSARC